MRTSGSIDSAVATRDVVEQHTGSETILVVDDEQAIRHLLTRVLATAGYDTREASDADQAIEILQQQPGQIQLLLTDVSLPGTNGFRLAAAASAIEPHLRVLFMSGYDRNGSPETAVDPPADMASIQKPFTPKEILSKIRVVLDCRRSE